MADSSDSVFFKIIYAFSAKRYSMKCILPQLKFIAKERQREIVIEAMDILEKYKITIKNSNLQIYRAFYNF